MEYSVFDLIRILIKKWYIILLAMCSIGGLSVFTAQKSYDLAVQNYEASISEIDSTGVDTGTLTATYLYDYELTDLTKYMAETRRKTAFYVRFAKELGTGTGAEPLDPNSLAKTAYAASAKGAIALLTDTRVMSDTQTGMNMLGYVEPSALDEDEKNTESDSLIDISRHICVETLPGSVVRVTVSGLEEQPARELLTAYLRNVEVVGLSDYSIRAVMTEQEKVFMQDPLLLSQSAEFAQVVMEKPEQSPILIKTVGTAAAYSFVLSCFLILVITFVKDSRRAEKAEKTA